MVVAKALISPTVAAVAVAMMVAVMVAAGTGVPEASLVAVLAALAVMAATLAAPAAPAAVRGGGLEGFQVAQMVGKHSQVHVAAIVAAAAREEEVVGRATARAVAVKVAVVRAAVTREVSKAEATLVAVGAKGRSGLGLIHLRTKSSALRCHTW